MGDGGSLLAAGRPRRSWPCLLLRAVGVMRCRADKARHAAGVAGVRPLSGSSRLVALVALFSRMLATPVASKPLGSNAALSSFRPPPAPPFAFCPPIQLASHHTAALSGPPTAPNWVSRLSPLAPFPPCPPCPAPMHAVALVTLAQQRRRRDGFHARPRSVMRRALLFFGSERCD